VLDDTEAVSEIEERRGAERQGTRARQDSRPRGGKTKVLRISISDGKRWVWVVMGGVDLRNVVVADEKMITDI
jgi:hypothetical protein